MRFDIGAGGTIVILVGLVGLSGAVFGLGLIAGHELASEEPAGQPAVAAYSMPAAPAPAATAAADSAAAPAAPLEPPASSDAVAAPPVAVAIPAPPPKVKLTSAPTSESPTDRKLNQAMAKIRQRVSETEHAAAQKPEDRIPPAPSADDVVPPPTVDYAAPAVSHPAAKHSPATNASTKTAKAGSSRRLAMGTAPTPGMAHGGPYSIQIDAVMDQAGAQQMAAKLRARGFVPYIIQSQIGDQTWYRVRVGHYTSPEEAKAAEIKLHQEFGDTPH